MFYYINMTKHKFCMIEPTPYKKRNFQINVKLWEANQNITHF
jgi:hypothetical protein